MKYLRISLLFTLTLIFALPAFSANENEAAVAEQTEEKEGINLKEILFGHVQDSYQWHITDIGDHALIIPLPMIFYSQHSGFHVLCSSQFAHEPDANHLRQGPDGFYIQGPEDEKGRIVEQVNGELVPVCFDISITKTVLVLFINAILLLLCILIPARWCKKHKVDDPAPKGFTGLVHMFVMSVYDDMIKPALGEEANKYAPYLLTAFFFIFLTNVMGIVPFPPGGGNLTGNITCTMFLALCTFLIVNVTGTKEYWKEIFWGDVPWWLKVPVPLMPFIEFFGIFTKPIALMIRLFANMLAGHVIAISLTCIIFVMFALGGVMGKVLGSFMTPVSIFLSICMMLLEVLVCYIQAMVFTMLSAVFISMSHVKHHG